MRKPFVVILIAMFALGALGIADAKSSKPRFDKPEAVLKWINGYRETPEPERLPDAVHAMAELGLFRELEQAGVYVGFMAGALSAEPARAAELLARMFPLAPEHQVFLVRAIAYSDLPEWRDLLIAFAERMPARKVLIEHYLYGDGKTLFNLPLDESAFVLDAHWGYYFGSGSRKALARIVTALEWVEEKDDVERLTFGAMSKWTLASNATRDEVLKAALTDELETASDVSRRHLRDVIFAAETFETHKIRKAAITAIDELKAKGPAYKRDYAWWGQTGQTVLALGCVAAGAMGQFQLGIPCVIGGAVSTAALKYLAPE
ncbi:MAG: hypothetical protein NW216_07775 [Hyphomicrobium sp.]|nr:hypothetical protein [Hyphomicrobium sp.]